LKFAELLSTLPPEGQASLLEALGDRSDVAARPAVLKMLESDQALVRAAALGAMGSLGNVSDVPLLVGQAAELSGPEQKAARQSLVRLRGDDINAALVAAMDDAGPGLRIEVLSALAARNAKDTLPDVLKNAEAPELPVRLAAIAALRFLADESNTVALVAIVKAAKDETERGKAALMLLATCSRGREACVDAIVAGLDDADVPSQIVLLQALARAGGDKALETIVARLEDDDEAVGDAAVRLLAGWPGPAAVPQLLSIAREGSSQRRQVLAIRGLVRLAAPQKEKPGDLQTLTEVMQLAKRAQEKRLVIGALGGFATPQSLALVAPVVDDPELATEAGLAAVMIAERIEDGDKDEIRSAIEKVSKSSQEPQIRERAQKVLESL